MLAKRPRNFGNSLGILCLYLHPVQIPVFCIHDCTAPHVSFDCYILKRCSIHELATVVSWSRRVIFIS
jgi:hypothetical protein